MSSINYELFQLGPMVGTPVETVENAFYWYHHPLNVFTGGTIVSTAADSGNTITDILRPGLILGRVYASGKYKEWNPIGTDGSQYIAAILDNPGVKMNANSVAKDRFRGTLMVRGQVNPQRLLIPGQAAFGITGIATEFLVRSQLIQAGFLLQEDPGVGSMLSSARFLRGYTTVIAKTADYTVSNYESGTLFTTRGAGGAVIFTLPTTPAKGLAYSFYNVANQVMTIGGAANAGTLVFINDLTGNTVGFNTASLMIGGMITVIADGTSWLVVVYAGQTSDGTTSGQLVTTAT